MTGAPITLVRPLAPQPERPDVVAALRPASLDGRAVHLVLSLPHGSGMEPLLASLAAEIERRYPTARVITIVRHDRYMTDDPDQRAGIVAAANACAVYFGSATGALNMVGAEYCVALEAAGVPTLIVVPPAFVNAVDHISRSLRCPLACLASDAPEFAAAAITVLLQSAPELAPAAAKLAARERVSDASAGYRLATTESWGDGLPLILPTEANVIAMLEGTRCDARQIMATTLGADAPTATVELVAANAVMAGARPMDLPLLLAMIEALGQNPQIRPMLSSVNGFCFPFVINGPIRDEIGLETGFATLDAHAHRAIERAIRLCVQNIFGIRPGRTAFPVQGHPAGSSFLIVENESASPWPSMATDDGASEGVSRVTLFGGGWSHIGTYFYADEGIDNFATALAQLEMPHSALVLLSPGRARLLAEQFGDKAAVARAIGERATIELRRFRRSGYYVGRIRDRIVNEGTWPAGYLDRPGRDMVPAYPPGGIRIVVSGSDAAPIMTAWKLEKLACATPDDWR